MFSWVWLIHLWADFNQLNQEETNPERKADSFLPFSGLNWLIKGSDQYQRQHALSSEGTHLCMGWGQKGTFPSQWQCYVRSAWLQVKQPYDVFQQCECFCSQHLSPWPPLAAYLHFRPAELHCQLFHCSYLWNLVIWIDARCIFNSHQFSHLVDTMAPQTTADTRGWKQVVGGGTVTECLGFLRTVLQPVLTLGL